MRSVSGKVINCYSHNDGLLKYLLKLVKAKIKPCGINPILNEDNHPKFENYNFSDFIDGHLSYNKNFYKILQKIDFNQDFNYLFKFL